MSEILARLAAVEEENRQLRQEVEALRRDHADHRETVGREIASDRRRITALETPALALSQKTAGDHLDKLFSEMRRLSIRQTTTKDAARLLGVSKPLVKKLKPYLAKDSRFVILRDPRHKQRHLIRLAGT
jgi:seryl-tRNA synthetase